MVERKKTGLAKARKRVCVLSVGSCMRFTDHDNFHSTLGSNVEATLSHSSRQPFIAHILTAGIMIRT